MHVIPGGVDTGVFDCRRRRRGHSKTGEKCSRRLVVGSVGRLVPIKAYETLVEAVMVMRERQMVRQLPRFVIVGEGPERGRLEQIVEKGGLTRDIDLRGERSDVVEDLCEFDLFVLCSRSEGTSVSLLEAMSCGVCPVVTDVGGNAEVLGPELKHRLVPVDSAEKLATAIAESLRDEPQRVRDGELARGRVESVFSKERMLKAHVTMYRRRWKSGE
jgi:glycosyltransferase involved in cell wall biosynthesis